MSRSERRGGAAHHIVAKAVVKEVQDGVKQIQEEKTWSLIIIRTDAFSSSTANTDAHKQQVTEVIIIVKNGGGARRFVPELQKVEFGTSQEFRSVILKQLENLGFDTWLDECAEDHFRMIIVISADGPDVGGGVRLG